MLACHVAGIGLQGEISSVKGEPSLFGIATTPVDSSNFAMPLITP